MNTDKLHLIIAELNEADKTILHFKNVAIYFNGNQIEGFEFLKIDGFYYLFSIENFPILKEIEVIGKNISGIFKHYHTDEDKGLYEVIYKHGNEETVIYVECLVFLKIVSHLDY